MTHFSKTIVATQSLKADGGFHYALPKSFDDAIRQKRYWSKLCEAFNIPGLALRTGNGLRVGQKIQSINVGQINEEGNRAHNIDQHTIFEAGSLSKTIASYLVFCLTKDGFFCPKKPLFSQLSCRTKQTELLKDIVDPLSRDRATRISAQMVLSHTAGFEGWRGPMPLSINSEPGVRFYYSGEGYLFLQRFLELYFAMNIEALFQQRLFPRLGMHRASFHCPNSADFALALGHNGQGSRLQKYSAPQAVIAGSLHASLQDYAQFLSHILQSSGGRGGYFEWLQQHTVPTGTQGAHWTPGWGFLPKANEQDHGLLWHWGDTGGYQSFVILEPLTGAYVNYFTNSQNGLNLLNKALQFGDFPISEQQIASIKAIIGSVTNQKPGLERHWFDYNAGTPLYALSYDD